MRMAHIKKKVCKYLKTEVSDRLTILQVLGMCFKYYFR